MKHEFTNNDLGRALDQVTYDAGKIQGVPYVTLRQFLDALPEPQDEWEACTIDQIRRGDKVRWQEPGREDTCIYEIIALQTTPEDPGWLLYSKTESYYFPPGAVVDRIPAPVQHPDPLHDLTILVHGAYGNQYKFPTAYTSDGSAYNIVGLGDTRILPEDITEWEPAKVVSKVVADDD